MIGKEVSETKPVSIDDVVDILGKYKEGELTYEQKIALEHAKKLTGGKGREKAKKALEGMSIFTEMSILKLIEVMPKNMMTLKQVLVKEKRTFTNEELQKALDILKGK